MAKRRTKRKRKVPTVKFDDMQRTNNVNVDAAMRSFEGPTKATLPNRERDRGLLEAFIRSQRQDDVILTDGPKSNAANLCDLPKG
jgi:hypothetical protein